MVSFLSTPSTKDCDEYVGHSHKPAAHAIVCTCLCISDTSSLHLYTTTLPTLYHRFCHTHRGIDELIARDGVGGAAIVDAILKVCLLDLGAFNANLGDVLAISRACLLGEVLPEGPNGDTRSTCKRAVSSLGHPSCTEFPHTPSQLYFCTLSLDVLLLCPARGQLHKLSPLASMPPLHNPHTVCVVNQRPHTSS